MNKDSKLLRLKEILNEYVTYLDGYSEVTVETKYRNKILVKIKGMVEEYGKMVEDVIKVEEVKIPLSEFIKITYMKPRVDKCYDFWDIEFPIDDLDKRLLHYENKVKYCKNKKNGNNIENLEIE